MIWAEHEHFQYNVGLMSKRPVLADLKRENKEEDWGGGREEGGAEEGMEGKVEC